MEQIGHNTVTAADHIRNGTHTVFDQLLGVAQPHIRTVRQAGNLQQIGKSFWLCLHEHSQHKGGAHLRDRQCGGGAVNILRRHADRLRRGDHLVQLGVAQVHIHHRNTCGILQKFIQGGHIVTQLVQLQQRIVKRVLKVKVCGIGTLALIVRREWA